MREARYRQIICELLYQFYHLGWATGTGGGMTIKNKSTGNIIMSPSAIQKERLKAHNLFVLDKDFNIIDAGYVNKADNVGMMTDKLKLTQCFTLFKSCFEIHPNTGCVIHSHSKNVALISLMFNEYVEICGLEMIKGISGHSNIDKCIIPIIQNTPKESQLTNRLQKTLKTYPKSYGVIVRGHGMYVFGKNWQKAKQHAECYDYLFQMIIEMKKLNIAENILYNTKILNKFPVKITDNNNVEDSIEYETHPHYPLFMVSNHPFINNNTQNKIAMIRSLIWQNDSNYLLLINQRIIPQKFGTVKCINYRQIAKHIKIMTVRGAPAIGAAAAYGMALAALEFSEKNINTNVSPKQFIQFMQNAKSILDSARPTAVNLVWATNRMQYIMNQCINILQQKTQQIFDINWFQHLSEILLREAHNICNEDISVCTRLGINGCSLIKKGFGVMHHCNTGSLATVCGGTALAAITKAFYDNKNIKVYVNETRPRLQGSRLTSWELSRMNINHKIVVDSACAHLISGGKIDCIIVGCDRAAINGDAANKIGTQTIATVAYQYGIPMYISCPVSTIDKNCKNGNHIIIEERNKNEIKQIGGIHVANPNADCYNPAFDVTPHKYITAFITEYGICYPPFEKSLRDVVNKQRMEVEAQRNQTLRKYIATMTNNITSKL
eukprot:445709_1